MNEAEREPPGVASRPTHSVRIDGELRVDVSGRFATYRFRKRVKEAASRAGRNEARNPISDGLRKTMWVPARAGTTFQRSRFPAQVTIARI